MPSNSSAGRYRTAQARGRHVTKKLNAKTSTVDRFFARVAPEPNCGCWLWTGACTGSDKGRYGNLYGVIMHDGHAVAAHRWSYNQFVGQIPDGHIIRHKCDVSICVNPDHLTTGTYQQNSRDREDRNRRRIQKGEDAPWSALTEADVIEIRNLAAVGVTDKELAARFGIAQGSIWHIKMGNRWKHVKHLVDLWKNKKP
jgi:hypothetical protein